MGRRAAEILLDHRETALGQEHLGCGDHGFGPLQDLASLRVHLLDGERFGHLQVDGSGAIFHSLFVIQIRELHLVLEVLGVQLYDLGELFEGPLDESFLGEVLRHGEMHLQGVLDHPHLAIHIRQPLAHIEIIRCKAGGLLEHRDAFLREAVPLVGDAQTLEDVDGLTRALRLDAEITDAVHQGQVFGIVLQEFAVFLDGLVQTARR